MVGELRLIPIDRCVPWYFNPFLRTADTPRWRRFLKHVRRRGQLYPIIVTLEPDGRYAVVDGHRRLEALRQLGFSGVSAIISPLSFEQAIDAYWSAEQHKFPVSGPQWGEFVRRLGLQAALRILPPPYRTVVARAYAQVSDPRLIEAALDSWGPRALQIALRFVGGDWPLDRVLTAMLRQQRIRDLEDRLKGLRGEARVQAGRRLLAEWEHAAEAGRPAPRGTACGTSNPDPIPEQMFQTVPYTARRART